MPKTKPMTARRNVAAARPGLVRLSRALAPLVLIWGLVSSQANAQEAQSGGQLVGNALETLNIKRATPPAADFVRATRPDSSQLDYTPITPAARDPKKKKKTQAELDATKSDLEAALLRNRRAAASVGRPVFPGAAAKKQRAAY